MPAAIGGLIIVVEGFQQLNKYQQNWISYRSTCEALRHEKYLHLAGAGPYAGTPNPTAASPTASKDSSPQNTSVDLRC